MDSDKFDWKTYISNYIDLQKAGINTEKKAWNHWVTLGKSEGRTYKTNVNKQVYEVHETGIIKRIYEIAMGKLLLNTGEITVYVSKPEILTSHRPTYIDYKNLCKFISEQQKPDKRNFMSAYFYDVKRIYDNYLDHSRKFLMTIGDTKNTNFMQSLSVKNYQCL